MKYIVSLLILIMTIQTYALEFEKGADVKDIHPRQLKSLLRQGINTYEGSKIVISKDAKVPSSIQKKWNQRKLTGESIPTVGEKSSNVIFIKAF